MGLAVVTVASGGLPVVETAGGGLPVTEAALGVAVTKVVGKPGLPVTFVSADGGPAVVPTTWNATDKSANITLAGGNLSASCTNTSDGGVRSTLSKTGKKVYFESAWGTSSGGDNGHGIATGAASFASLAPNGTGGVIAFIGSGNIYYNGSLAGISLGSLASVTTCFAVDLINKRFWARKAGGPWNNNAGFDPATNTGGIDISTLFASAPAFAAATFNSTTGTATINYGATAFTQAIPAGFTAWNLA